MSAIRSLSPVCVVTTTHACLCVAEVVACGDDNGVGGLVILLGEPIRRARVSKASEYKFSMQVRWLMPEGQPLAKGQCLLVTPI